MTKIGIVTISDRVTQGVYEDKGAPAIQAYCERVIANMWDSVTRVIPDEQHLIESTLIELADDVGCDWIITTGGTGISERDVTPEAVEAVITKRLNGFGEVMRAASLKEVPTAILSRQLAGVRGQSFIVTLPGSPRAIETCLDAIILAVPHALELIGATPFKLA